MTKGGRAELAAQEREEIAAHLRLSAQADVGRQTVKAAISAAIAETGAAEHEGTWARVIGVLRAKFAGQRWISARRAAW